MYTLNNPGGVLLAGGGLDSMALLVFLAKDMGPKKFTVMHVNYGQKAWYPEWKAIEFFTGKYGLEYKGIRCDLKDIAKAAILTGQEVGTSPEENRLEGRNIVLMSLAATYACTIGVSKVWVGFHDEPTEAPFPDATRGAVAKMQELVRLAYHPQLTIRAPFEKKSRLEIFMLGRELDPEIETRSHTCYEGRMVECGECVHCKQKAEMQEALRCAAL